MQTHLSFSGIILIEPTWINQIAIKWSKTGQILGCTHILCKLFAMGIEDRLLVKFRPVSNSIDSWWLSPPPTLHLYVLDWLLIFYVTKKARVLLLAILSTWSWALQVGENDHDSFLDHWRGGVWVRDCAWGLHVATGDFRAEQRTPGSVGDTYIWHRLPHVVWSYHCSLSWADDSGAEEAAAKDWMLWHKCQGYGHLWQVHQSFEQNLHRP